MEHTIIKYNTEIKALENCNNNDNVPDNDTNYVSYNEIPCTMSKTAMEFTPGITQNTKANLEKLISKFVVPGIKLPAPTVQTVRGDSNGKVGVAYEFNNSLIFSSVFLEVIYRYHSNSLIYLLELISSQMT